MLKLVIFALILVLALSFFGISIQSIVTSPTGQENFGYLNYLVQYVWDFIVSIGQWFVDFFQNLIPG